ncbi:phenylalanine 4-monooxygenase [soil metagenome]
MPASNVASSGLTTTESPFIEAAQASGRLFIEQPYELYSEANHEAWRRLFARMRPLWEQYGNDRFLLGLQTLCLDPNRVPKLDDVNEFLCPRTGFTARAVSGYVPAYLFFESLRSRAFPTTITIRRGDSLDYLPEPDIFHDIAGHVPMHTDLAFADALVKFGDVAHAAAERASELRGDADVRQRLAGILRGMARFFWFTVEFGLMKQGSELRAYGSGLLSSYGELQHCIESPDVQRYPVQLEWIINQGFEIDHYQPLLFWVESFDHLFELVGQLENWVRDGKLDHTAPGEPLVNEADLEDFLLSPEVK